MVRIGRSCSRNRPSYGSFIRGWEARQFGTASTLNCMRKQVEIVNKLGLHARPAALFSTTPPPSTLSPLLALDDQDDPA